MSYCINCGTKLTDGVRFCTGCGTPVSSGSQATEPLPPQTEIKIEEQQAPPVGVTPVQPQTATVAAPLQPQPTPIYTAPVQPQSQPAYVAQGLETPPPIGSRYAPVSTGEFIGIFLLMLIPLVNLILLIIWACGGCRKVNQTNLARAMLIMMLIGVVLTVVLSIAFWGVFASLGGLDGIKDSIMNEVMKSATE